LLPGGGSGVQPVPAYKIPEARVPIRGSCDEYMTSSPHSPSSSRNHEEFTVASPHSPLNWGIGTMAELLAYLRAAVQHAEAHETTTAREAAPANRRLGTLSLSAMQAGSAA
jgi:hypothetical protein